MKNIITYFEELSQIPRKSGDEKRVSDYLASFARERGFEAVQDDIYNLIVKIPASEGSTCGETVILQGHMDMVYVEAEGTSHRYEEGIKILRDGDSLYADGTTLGADNGIALACMMALMDQADVIRHPALEMIMTVNEEHGLIGAQKLDVSGLEGKYFINLDSEEEGVFCTSCAGGIRNLIKLPFQRETCEGSYEEFKIEIGGLTGGHSGMEIHLERGNAIQMLGRLMYRLKEENVRYGQIDFPGQANAIASGGSVVLYADESRMERVSEKIRILEEELIQELAFTDQVKFTVQRDKKSVIHVYDQTAAGKLCNLLMLMPCGVLHDSYAVEGLVETSNNMGALIENEGKLELLSAVRSAVQSRKYVVRDQIRILADMYGAECEFMSDYPAWSYKKDSRLRTLAMEVYQELTGQEAKIEAIHAGLECGYWAGKMPEADIISLGADMKDVHTPKETASVKSAESVWNYLCTLLGRIKEETKDK